MYVIATVEAGTSPLRAAVHLAELAQVEDVVVICGYSAAAPLMAGLRGALPLFQVLGLVVDPPTIAEATLIESLLATGSLPVAATSDERVREVGAWLTRRLPGTVHHQVVEPLGTPVL
jgi:hypothetical protein